MKTYYIRHTSKLAISKEMMQEMWDNKLFGIHFPHDKSPLSNSQDSQSLDPQDYEGQARSCLKRLKLLAKEGGYVFAYYRGITDCLIGYVEPDSKVALLKGMWANKNRVAYMKVLKLSRWKKLSPDESLFLISQQPRQGTFCQWHKVGNRLQAILNGQVPYEWKMLSPDAQEVMCMEFLKTKAALTLNIPCLQHTLMPVGRTLKDVDILGLATDGKTICAQVTGKNLASSKAKLAKLDPYSTPDTYTLYFCSHDKIETKGVHQIIPLQTVFEHFCQKGTIGEAWFNKVTGR